MPLNGTLLHCGCGTAPLPGWAAGVVETRLDIDPKCKPDIVAPLTDLGDIGEYDFIYSSHVLEHVYPHEAGIALQEAYRVLKDGGVAMVIVPNLANVKPNRDPLYEIEVTVTNRDNMPNYLVGITGLDMYFGCAWMIEENPYMAHKNGFIPETLKQEFEESGFEDVSITNLTKYDIMATGKKVCQQTNK